MHKVVNRLGQALSKGLMHAAGTIVVDEIVPGKPAGGMFNYPAIIFFRIFPYIAVNGSGEQMPKSGLDKPPVKELPDDLQGINGFLFRL